MVKTSNKNARQYVQDKKEFTGNNTLGRWVDEDNYVVYSYGIHFPMFAYKKNFGWCTQISKYKLPNGTSSVTTSKHYTQLNPHDKDMGEVAGVPELREFVSAKGKTYPSRVVIFGSLIKEGV